MQRFIRNLAAAINKPARCSTHSSDNNNNNGDTAAAGGDAAEPPKFVTTPSAAYHRELSRLDGVRSLRLHQTRTLEKKILPQTSTSAQKGGGLVRSEISVTDTVNNHLLYKMVFSRGVVLHDFSIRLMSSSSSSDLELATMFLKRSLRYRALVLRIRSPPEFKYASVYELPGISHVALIKSKKESKTFLQLLANGPLGWATNAKILSSDGVGVVGKIVKIPRETEKLLTADITLTKEIPPIEKVCLIGGAVAMMCRYQF